MAYLAVKFHLTKLVLVKTQPQRCTSLSTLKHFTLNYLSFPDSDILL